MTYCTTVPSLAALEKRVHVTDPSLLPPQMMVEYEVPDDLATRMVTMSDLPVDWTIRETITQKLGDEWLDGSVETLLFVPSAIVPLASAPERNVLINHRQTASIRIAIVATSPFTLDPRLFQP